MPIDDIGEQQFKNIARRYGCIGWRRTEAPRLQRDLRHCRFLDKPSIAAMGYSRSGSTNRLSGGSASDGRSRGSKRNGVAQ
jgi:hypothetical protein